MRSPSKHQSDKKLILKARAPDVGFQGDLGRGPHVVDGPQAAGKPMPLGTLGQRRWQQSLRL